MPIADRFRQTLVVERLGPSTATTPRGHAVKAFVDHHTTRGKLEETAGREVTGPNLAGPVIADARIFLSATEDVTEADVIRNADNGRRYELLFVYDPGGRGRHQQAEARRIAVPA